MKSHVCFKLASSPHTVATVPRSVFETVCIFDFDLNVDTVENGPVIIVPTDICKDDVAAVRLAAAIVAALPGAMANCVKVPDAVGVATLTPASGMACLHLLNWLYVSMEYVRFVDVMSLCKMEPALLEMALLRRLRPKADDDDEDETLRLSTDGMLRCMPCPLVSRSGGGVGVGVEVGVDPCLHQLTNHG